jgi:hypothetical protein
MAYQAMDAAGKAVDAGITKHEETMTDLEQLMHEQAEQKREERLFGKNPSQETYSDNQREE